jgi:hypothetical protein
MALAEPLRCVRVSGGPCENQLVLVRRQLLSGALLYSIQPIRACGNLPHRLPVFILDPATLSLKRDSVASISNLVDGNHRQTHVRCVLESIL